MFMLNFKKFHQGVLELLFRYSQEWGNLKKIISSVEAYKSSGGNGNKSTLFKANQKPTPCRAVEILARQDLTTPEVITLSMIFFLQHNQQN